MNAAIRLRKHAPWLLRASALSALVFHGLAKFHNIEEFTRILSNPTPVTVFISIVELMGCLLLLMGGIHRNVQSADLATRIGAALNIFALVGIVVLLTSGNLDEFILRFHHDLDFQLPIALIALMSIVMLRGNRGFGH